MPTKIALAGEGAFGLKHLEALARIPDVEVISLAGGVAAVAESVARRWKIPHWTDHLADSLRLPGLDAVILATPTPIHARQAEMCMRAGKHVLIEIPIADSIADSRRILQVQKETGMIAMAGHVRRFNPSHQYVHNKIRAGELQIQQLDVQTYFFRRTNTNAAGQPRSWTDHLLWHHAAHTVDLFMHQTGGQKPTILNAVQGPLHLKLKIAMDMSIQMQVPSGAILSLSLSFNNDGPFGSFFRYICDNGTYKALYDDLVDGKDQKIDVSKVDISMDGVELEDREFIAAIREKRQPKSSVADVMPCMEVLHDIEARLTRSIRART